MKTLFTKVLLGLWRAIRGRLQWYALWFWHDKFIIGVAVVVFNNNGELLLLKHRFWPNNAWGLPGGYINKGETLEAAAAREVKEETGLDVSVKSLLSVRSGFKLRLESTFIAICDDPNSFQIDTREIMEARFCRPDDLPQGTWEAHKELIKYALARVEIQTNEKFAK